MAAKDYKIYLNELLSNPAFLSIEKILKYNSYNHGVWFNKNKLMKQYKQLFSSFITSVEIRLHSKTIS